MFVIHQIVGVLSDPVFAGLFALAIGLVFVRRRWGRMILVLDLILMWICAMPVTSELLAKWIEADYYPVRNVQELPQADAIVLLGGGIGAPPEGSDWPYPDLKESADRVWHAARLYKAGKAPKIYCTCLDVSRSTPPFLKDLGVPAEAIVPIDGPRNTEEEARLYNEAIERRADEKKRQILLVTSAAHMKRAVRIFAKFAPDLAVVPAAIDFAYIDSPAREFTVRRYLPDVAALGSFNSLVHELLGLVRYSF